MKKIVSLGWICLILLFCIGLGSANTASGFSKIKVLNSSIKYDGSTLSFTIMNGAGTSISDLILTPTGSGCGTVIGTPTGTMLAGATASIEITCATKAGGESFLVYIIIGYTQSVMGTIYQRQDSGSISGTAEIWTTNTASGFSKLKVLDPSIDYKGNTLSFTIMNGAGQTVTDLSLTATEDGSRCSPVQVYLELNAGDTAAVTFTCSTFKAWKESFSVDVTIKYTQTVVGTPIQRQETGTIYGTADIPPGPTTTLLQRRYFSISYSPEQPLVGNCITLTATDRSTGSIVMDADVDVYRNGINVFYGLTDSNGLFVFCPRLAGSYEIIIDKTRYREYIETIEVGSYMHLSITEIPSALFVGKAIKVRVVDDTYNPVSGATVTVRKTGFSESYGTDFNGYATFTLNEAGIYDAFASKLGYNVTASTIVKLDVKVGGTLGVSITPKDAIVGSAVRIVVTAADGSLLPGAKIQITKPDGTKEGLLTTPDTGQIWYTPATSGTYLIRVEESSHLPKDDSFIALNEFTLTLPEIVLYQDLTMLVRDQNGLPVGGATVLVGGSTVTGATDNDGKFTFKLTTPSTYTITVTKINFRDKTQTINTLFPTSTTVQTTTTTIIPSENKIYVYPATKIVQLGDTFTMDVKIRYTTLSCTLSECDDAYGVQLGINFDPNVLATVSVTEGDFLKGGGASTFFISGSIDNGNGEIKNVAITRLQQGIGITGEGTLMRVTFKAKDTVALSQTSDISLTNLKVLTSKNKDIKNQFSIANGVISVQEGSLDGDVNGDCSVDIEDLMAVAKVYGCDCGNSCYDKDADLNNDCSVDITDLSIVAQNFGGSCGIIVTPTTTTTISTTTTPQLDAFVVSNCPYGLQIQRVLIPVMNALDSSANIRIRYIGSVSGNKITSMHGDNEAQENLRQICIREEQVDKFIPYLSCYIQAGKTDDCLTEAKVDKAKLTTCMTDTTKGIAYAKEDFALQAKYSVSGSPTLILNGEKANEFDFGGRTAEALKTMICCGFNTKPAACSTTLDTREAATSFSTAYSGASSTSA